MLSSSPLILRLASFAVVLSLSWLPSQPSTFAQESTALLETATSTHVETADFQRVADEVVASVDKFGADSVLVVIDIDNTLLAMNQPLGSDQWFGWQESLLAESPEASELASNSFGELLQVQGTLFALSKMHPPEPKLPELIQEIQATRCTTVVLTSRGPDYRDATERELARNEYDFATTALVIEEEDRGMFAPYDVDSSGNHGLSPETIETLGSPRLVSYSAGIYMTAGQHKGYMLQTLIARSERTFSKIIFVDDHSKHTERMLQAFAETETAVAAFRYSREDGNVELFQESDKTRVVRQWQKLSAAIEEVLVH